MLGLGGYASSEEEEDDWQDGDEYVQLMKDAPADDRDGGDGQDAGEGADSAVPKNITILPAQDDQATPGPAPGPSMPPAEAGDNPYEDASPPGSPRETIRNLTMPPVPNFAIPPSPPGSPPASSTKKFEHFLKLKKSGVSFNERLQNTPALKNPTLFLKLKKHAGISEEEQYASTLSEEVAVPTSYPPWAYADELLRSQVKIRTKREEEVKRRGRDGIGFVPGKSSAPSSGTNTPGGLRQGVKSGAERVLEGLNEDKKSSPGGSGRKR